MIGGGYIILRRNSDLDTRSSEVVVFENVKATSCYRLRPRSNVIGFVVLRLLHLTRKEHTVLVLRIKQTNALCWILLWKVLRRQIHFGSCAALLPMTSLFLSMVPKGSESSISSTLRPLETKTDKFDHQIYQVGSGLSLWSTGADKFQSRHDKRDHYVLCLAELLKLELSIGLCQFWNTYTKSIRSSHTV